MPLLAIGGAILVSATNILLRPLSTALNRRRRVSLNEESTEDGADGSQEFVLEVLTNVKSEQRVRAQLVQAVSHPQLRLRSVRLKKTKNGGVQIRAEVSMGDAEHVDIIERATSHMGTDPQVIASRWWPIPVDA